MAPAPPRKRARCQPKQDAWSWKTENDNDATPSTLRCFPAREPGVQLSAADNHTPLDLFKLFFSEDAVETICHNTNKQAARNVARGAKYRWVDVGVADIYKYMGLIFYMGLMKLRHISDYWRKDTIYSFLFPPVMVRDRYRAISWNVHTRDTDEERVNDAQTGTSAHDGLFRLRPLMNTIQNACKAFYHPHRNIAVAQHMVACQGA